MRQNSIESLDQFLHATVHPIELLKMAPEKVNTFLCCLNELKESTRRQLLQDIINSKSEEETEFLVKRYQIILGILLNLLYEYQKDESITPTLKQFYQQGAAVLEDFIVFLKKTFTHYFNTNLISPLPYLVRQGYEIKCQLKLFLKANSGVDDDARLLDMFDNVVNDLFSCYEERQITYGQVSYINTLIKEISAYLSSRHSSIYGSLTELLIIWNFNELTFILEVCNRLKIEVDQKESEELRREFLRTFLKQVSQLTEKPGQSFNVTQSSAKHMISEWVSLELAYCQSNTDIQEDKKSEGCAKIQTSLSVPVLALFTRLLKDTGIYANSNQEDIIRFVSSHYTTIRKLEVSYSHLRSKFYQIDEGTKKKVYEHLMEMAQRCKKI